MNNIIIPRLNEGLFEWLNWGSGSIHDLGVFCRYWDIVSDRGIAILRKHAIGYCPGERLRCRPKKDEVALMVHKDGIDFWFHLRKEEFIIVFGN